MDVLAVELKSEDVADEMTAYSSNNQQDCQTRDMKTENDKYCNFSQKLAFEIKKEEENNSQEIYSVDNGLELDNTNQEIKQEDDNTMISVETVKLDNYNDCQIISHDHGNYYFNQDTNNTAEGIDTVRTTSIFHLSQSELRGGNSLKSTLNLDDSLELRKMKAKKRHSPLVPDPNYRLSRMKKNKYIGKCFLDAPATKRFVECDSGSSTPAKRPRLCEPISSAEVIHQLNYGSEPDSDESGDEDSVAPALVPRSFRMFMETPEDEPTASTEPAVELAADGLLPNNLYNFEWTAFPNPPIPPESRREEFPETNVGPTTPCVDPYDTFIAIWDRQFMEYIASETNKYAQLLTVQMMANQNLRPTSRICDWKDTTADELYTYFALLLAMGIVVKSRIDEYWNVNNDIFYTPGFSAQMSLRRFQLLSRCLHFNDNENMCALELDASEARLYKIEPVLSHLNNKFQTLYNMRQNIALDESLLQWKGWLDINQFIPNKAAAVGIKTYEICESQTGYLWRFEVHAHRKGSLPQQQSDPLDASTPAIVLRLIQGLENKGHTLWMDNYYNSPALARRLKTLGFDCVGTLRTNRQFMPEALTSLTKADMRPGQIAGFTSGDVDLMVWRDQNRVATISTYHGNAITEVNGTTKPILISDYNLMMGGVDKKDQMLAMYPIERKRTKVWYKKLFRRLLNVSVLNSFILVKQSSSSITHRAFRISLIKSLIAKHSFRPFPSTTAATSQNILFHAKIHRLSAYPFMPGNRQRQRHVCCQCKKRIHLYCVGCDKPVCMEPCFAVLHGE